MEDPNSPDFTHIEHLQKKLLQWYLKNQRRLPWRETNDPYRIWVSEVMLQQTQVKTVLPYYEKFLARFPDIDHLAAADLQDVLKIWEGLGYYARARNMHRAAQIILAEHKGEIPEKWAEIRQLPGVGDYIAAAVLSIAYNRPHAVVDGNVKRVLARLYENDAPVNKSTSHNLYKEDAGRLLDVNHPGTFNQAVMELGALVCKPKQPLCSTCPWGSFCSAYHHRTVDEYPKRIKQKPRPLHHIAVGVVYKNNRMLITRRKPEGLLGGLWEFPGGKVGKNESPEAACIREIKEEVNLNVKIDYHVTQVAHAYTHFKIVMDVFACRYVSGEVVLSGPVDHRWIMFHEIDRYPFPKANHKFIPILPNPKF